MKSSSLIVYVIQNYHLLETTLEHIVDYDFSISLTKHHWIYSIKHTSQHMLFLADYCSLYCMDGRTMTFLHLHVQNNCLYNNLNFGFIKII